MKKFAAGVMLGFVASWAVAFASPNVGHNGVFWNRLNNAAKDGYVNGYSDAMRVSVAKLDSADYPRPICSIGRARAKIIHRALGSALDGAI